MSPQSQHANGKNRQDGAQRQLLQQCIDAVPKLAEKLRVTVLLLQFKRLYKLFRQGLGFVHFACQCSIEFDKPRKNENHALWNLQS